MVMLVPVEPRKTVEAVLSEYWDGNLPVRPDLIARRQGIIVSQAPMRSSGLVHRRSDGQVEIIVNDSESSIRNRFTIAHELGHYNLGHLKDQPLWRDDLDSYSTASRDPKERAANDFAARLLMPPDAIRYALQHGKARTVDELRRLFGVSEVAMRFRLKNLGYL